MCEALRELFAEDFEKARKETVDQAILIFIETLLEDGYSEQSVSERLQNKFFLSVEDALDYIQQITNKVA